MVDNHLNISILTGQGQSDNLHEMLTTAKISDTDRLLMEKLRKLRAQRRVSDHILNARRLTVSQTGAYKNETHPEQLICLLFVCLCEGEGVCVLSELHS